MKKIAIVSADRRLYRKIALALRGEAVCELMPSGGSLYGFDIIFLDERTGGEVHPAETLSEPLSGRCIRIVPRDLSGEGCLGYPFGFAELRAATEKTPGTAARLSLEEGGRYVILDGRRIHLTEVEHRLLLAMYAGGGEYVPRESLKASVWGEGAEGGVLSVYVHYLREKLEAGGERVIFSSRGGGYKIHERFIGGGK